MFVLFHPYSLISFLFGDTLDVVLIIMLGHERGV
jgi:hypothetical protein